MQSKVKVNYFYIVVFYLIPFFNFLGFRNLNGGGIAVMSFLTSFIVHNLTLILLLFWKLLIYSARFTHGGKDHTYMGEKFLIHLKSHNSSWRSYWLSQRNQVHWWWVGRICQDKVSCLVWILCRMAEQQPFWKHPSSSLWGSFTKCQVSFKKVCLSSWNGTIIPYGLGMCVFLSKIPKMWPIL